MEHIPLGLLALWHHPSKLKTSKGVVLIVHGIGEHSGRHSNTVDFITAKGFDVVRFDLRGAGKSGGRRQWVENFEDYVEDTNAAFNWIHRKLESKPIFLLGHSMGGAIAISFAAERGNALAGLILSAPAYEIGDGISPIKIAVGKFLVRFAPHLRMPRVTSSTDISRDSSVIEQYEKDPLSCHFVTLQLGDEILRTLELLPQRAKKIECPVILFHGTDDRIVDPSGSENLIKALASKDKTLEKFEGGYHELHNDLDKEKYFSSLLEWMQKRLPKAKPKKTAAQN